MRKPSNYHSNPERTFRRSDEHGLHCEFRYAVNAGLVSQKDFAAFVEMVDSLGGLKNLRRGQPFTLTAR